MKTILLLVLAIIVLSSTAFGAVITADCSLASDNIIGAQLQFDNGTWIDVPVVQQCVGKITTITCTAPSVTFCYSLNTLPNGSHVAKARWMNLWEVSLDSLPLNFVKGGPSSSPILHVK